MFLETLNKKKSKFQDCDNVFRQCVICDKVTTFSTEKLKKRIRVESFNTDRYGGITKVYLSIRIADNSILFP